jgi:DNA-binding transcriptional ArsR family regulator
LKSAAEERLDDVEAVFSALAHPARRQILLTVHFWGGAMSAGEIARRFGHSWPTTTRHLRVLTDAALLLQERQGRARLYRLNRCRLAAASDWLSWFDGRAHAGDIPSAAIEGRPTRRARG